MADPINELQKGSLDPNAGEKKWWSYYDRAVMAAATLEHVMFQDQYGSAAGKNISDTNMLAAGEVQQAHHFSCQMIKVSYFSDAAKTVAQFQNVLDMFRTSVLELFYASKSAQFQRNLALIMGAAFPQHITGGAAGDTLIGQTMYSGLCQLPIPIILAAKINFRVVLTHTTAVDASLADDEVYVELIGTQVNL